MPQKKGNLIHFLVLFMYKSQKLNSFGPIAPNVRLIFTETPFTRIGLERFISNICLVLKLLSNSGL